MATLRIGTRRSRLALWQTEHVQARLQARWPHLRIEIVPFTTRGDREWRKDLPEIGGKGLFTAELEAALLEGRIDLAVHSLKDLPTQNPPGLTVAAVLPREEPHDAWLSKHGLPLDALPPNPVIGTSSQRRAALVRLLRPDARIMPLRGNVDTRVRKALAPHGPYDGAVLAWAGLHRLGLDEHVLDILAPPTWLPAPGQGAIAVQTRTHDERVLRYVRALDHRPTRLATLAERALLEGLGGGCALPIGAWGRVEGQVVRLSGVFVPHGRALRSEGWAPATEEAARALGFDLAAQLQAQAQGQSSTASSSGPTVLVLRAAEQAPAMAQALRAAGFTPVLYPVLRIEPASGTDLDAALERLAQGAYHWLVLTSVNGVRAVQAHMAAQGLTLPESVHIAVIGPATARAVRAWGYTPALMPDAFVAEALAAALGEVQGQRILLARADRARPTLRHLLREQGAQVDEVVAYHTRVITPQIPPPETDWVAFTSPSTVEGYRAAYQASGAPWPPPVRVACIGPITARAAREVGLAVHTVARAYTLEGVIAAMQQATKARD